MGQTYSIYLKVEFLNKRLAASALQAKIGRAREEHINYSLDHYKEIGVGTDTVEDLLKIFFGGWDADLRRTRDGGLESGFDASYGWESVMMDAFDVIAPYIEDGSYIEIYPDSGVDKGLVKNGETLWVI